MIVLLNNNFLNFKNSILFIIILTFIFFSDQRKSLFTKVKADEIIRKSLLINQTNKKTIEEVLKAVGYNKNEAIQATNLLLNFFPLEKLNKSSYLILPPIGNKMKKFALNVDGKEAILIDNNNNFFTAYITSSEKAQSIVSNEYKKLGDLEGVLKLEKEKTEIKINFISREIYFNKGSTLTKILRGMDNIKNIRSFIKILF